MAREAVLVVGLVVLGVLFALAVQVARLRARVLRHERAGAELARTVGTVQGWAANELRALRDELTAAPPALLPEADPEEQRDTVAMPAHAAKPGNDDGDETTFFEPHPPMYATRSPQSGGLGLIRPPAPLAHPDLIGSEDAADEAARPHLGPDETTPPRRGRSAVLVPVFQAAETAERV
jgi:hypothetical protein